MRAGLGGHARQKLGGLAQLRGPGRVGGPARQFERGLAIAPGIGEDGIAGKQRGIVPAEPVEVGRAGRLQIAPGLDHAGAQSVEALAQDELEPRRDVALEARPIEDAGVPERLRRIVGRVGADAPVAVGAQRRIHQVVEEGVLTAQEPRVGFGRDRAVLHDVGQGLGAGERGVGRLVVEVDLGGLPGQCLVGGRRGALLVAHREAVLAQPRGARGAAPRA